MHTTHTTRTRLYTITAAVAFSVLGLLGGSAVAIAATASPQDTVTYSTNDNGETFGSAITAKTPADEPDLIEAIGTNGERGYVRGSDLVLPATTPEDNIRNTEIYAAGFTVPVYETDGKTVIGEFLVGGNTVTSGDEALRIVTEDK